MSYCAFFDLDETIIKAKSMFAVIEEYYRLNSRFKLLAKLRFLDFKICLSKFAIKNPDRNKINRFYYEKLSGFSLIKMNMAGKEWVARNKDNIFNSKILMEIERHRKCNAEIIIVTGSFNECAKPIADYLGINHVICAELEEIDGLYTGNMLSQPVIGEGKARAIVNFIKEKELSLCNSYAYGDHDSDISMLSLADNSVVVGNNCRLVEHAKKQNWLVIS